MLSKFINKFDWTLATVAYILLAFLYIYPGGVAMVSNLSTITMSDGTDPVVSSYFYSFIINQFKTNPLNLLYGSIFIPHMDAPTGYALWVPGIERIIILLSSILIIPEQINTALVIASMLLNGLSMFFFGKILGINKSISFAMGMAWAFSSYTRARAKVHMGLVGIYHMPFVFLGFYLIFKRTDFKSLFIASICFLIASLMSFYYVVTLVFISPFFLIFGFLISNNKNEFITSLKRLFLAILPAFAWLLFSITNPIPSEYSSKTSPFPTSGVAQQGHLYHHYLDWFGSHPIDFFTGDVGLGTEDNNPLRQELNEYVYSNPLNSNAHERANGIRWSLWIITLITIISLAIKKDFISNKKEKSLIYFFILFGLFSFILSLSPFVNFYNFSPSYWLYKLVSQIRVPNRAGIGVHFSTIIISGIFIKNLITNIKTARKINLINFFFPFILICDFPPMNLMMPMTEVLPIYQELHATGPDCGYGIQFPYTSTQIATFHYNYLLQQLRDSSCSIVNIILPTSNFTNQPLSSSFGLTQQIVNDLEKGDNRKIEQLKNFAECVPLNWIVFHNALSINTQQRICSQLGWTLKTQGVCLGPKKINQQILKSPDKCLNYL